jgi:hypothetical protein
MNPTKILNDIEMLPAIKSLASAQTEDLRVLWQIQKEELRLLEAKVSLQKKCENPKISVGELNLVLADTPEVYQKRLDVIQAESLYRKKNIEAVKCDDAFNGARKIMSWHIAELENTRRM